MPVKPVAINNDETGSVAGKQKSLIFCYKVQNLTCPIDPKPDKIRPKNQQ